MDQEILHDVDSHDATVERAADAFRLNEDLALAQLKDRSLDREVVEQISQNAVAMKSRKVRLSLAAHPRTPRRIALRLIRELHTFDLMAFAMMLAAPADLKRVADEALVTRLVSLTLGERISLARRASGRVAGALLLDKEEQIWRPALENPRLTEAAVVKAVNSATVPSFVAAVSQHGKWSLRAEVRMALLCSAHTPLAQARAFARLMPAAQLRDILHVSRLPEGIKGHLREELLTSH
jgi:hypothetical protein